MLFILKRSPLYCADVKSAQIFYKKHKSTYNVLDYVWVITYQFPPWLLSPGRGRKSLDQNDFFLLKWNLKAVDLFYFYFAFCSLWLFFHSAVIVKIQNERKRFSRKNLKKV